MHLSLALLYSYVLAQAGGGAAAPSTNPFVGYSCPSSCTLPACSCAKTTPPVSDPPQFLMLTFDDAIQVSLMPQIESLLNRKNPNGCPVQTTFFSQVLYSDPYLLTQWYANGHEVADHSFSHGAPFAGNCSELESNRAWINAYAGIPRQAIRGVRFPFRSFTRTSIEMIAALGYEYDSSMSARGGDITWPYTLDYGVITQCSDNPLCGKQINAKGLWEVPMYTSEGAEGPHLMDPYNDPNTSPEQARQTLMSTFKLHVSGNKAPFGLYVHPTWLGNPPPLPGSNATGADKLAAMNKFLTDAMATPNTWMVTNSQVIEYMKNPVPASELASQPYMQCRTPTPNICNGGPSSTGVQSCSLPSGPIRTCYNCPSIDPTLKNPIPPPVKTDRCAVPDTCDMIYWDPVGCKCNCTGPTCAAYHDTSRAIQLNPADVTGDVPGVTGPKKNSAASTFFGEALATVTALLAFL